MLLDCECSSSWYSPREPFYDNRKGWSGSLWWFLKIVQIIEGEALKQIWSYLLYMISLLYKYIFNAYYSKKELVARGYVREKIELLNSHLLNKKSNVTHVNNCYRCCLALSTVPGVKIWGAVILAENILYMVYCLLLYITHDSCGFGLLKTIRNPWVLVWLIFLRNQYLRLFLSCLFFKIHGGMSTSRTYSK